MRFMKKLNLISSKEDLSYNLEERVFDSGLNDNMSASYSSIYRSRMLILGS